MGQLDIKRGKPLVDIEEYNICYGIRYYDTFWTSYGEACLFDLYGRCRKLAETLKDSASIVIETVRICLLWVDY